jgi:lysophospholipase L1-like esterase
VEADGMRRIPPSHAELVYGGRVDCRDPLAVGFAHAGGHVRARFSGTALDFVYRDGGQGSETATNYFSVVIDDRPPVALKMEPGEKVYPLARALAPGEHSVLVFKRTEGGQQGQAGSGEGAFLGLRVPDGAELLPPYPRAHRVEFIGDSITCAYGAGVSTTTPDNAHYTSKNANAYASWAAVTARTLDADLMLVCYSGRGAYRNFQGGGGDAMPALYPRTLPDRPTPLWDFSVFEPEVIVVNLGTNDFSPGGVDREKFRAAYGAFVESLRARSPHATLILAVGPMMSDFWPPNESAWTNIQADVKSLIDARRTAGDDNVHLLVLPTQQAPYGEDWHPTEAEHARMAERTVALIRSLRKW